MKSEKDILLEKMNKALQKRDYVKVTQIKTQLSEDRQNKLEPVRLQKTIMEITNLGLKITSITQKMIEFEFKGSTVRFYPYSG